MQTRFVALAGTFALALGAPAFAHHGWGGQQTEKTEISGTLKTDVSLSGPHATMQITDEKGQVWDVTLAPPPRTQNAGLTPGIITGGG
jgi:hypothetical protein